MIDRVRCLMHSLWRWQPSPVDTLPPLPSPIVVAANSCQDVVIRWQSLVPVDRYIVQRLPNRNHKNQWTRLVDGYAVEVIDRHVQLAQEYTYRVQAVRGALSSSFVNYTIVMNNSLCFTPSMTQKCVSEEHASSMEPWNGFHCCVFIVFGFIILYIRIRWRVTDAENAQTRYDRLRRIQKTTLEQSHQQSFVSTPSDLSTQSSSSSLESSSRQESTELVLPSGATLRQSIRIEYSSHPQESNTLAVTTHHHCEQCNKKFCLFRHRHVCNTCERVNLCRKCVTVDRSRQSMVEWRNGSQLERKTIICSRCLNNGKSNITDQLPEQSDRRKNM